MHKSALALVDTGLMRRVLRYRGRVKVVEQTGQWGVYSGERIVLRDGRALDDDLGIKIRKVFQDGARNVLAAGGSPSEAFELDNVKIKITVRRRRWRRRGSSRLSRS